MSERKDLICIYVCVYMGMCFNKCVYILETTLQFIEVKRHSQGARWQHEDLLTW